MRFLWIADMSRVDALLITLVVGLTGFATAMAPAAPASPIGTRMLAIMIMGGTLMFLWSASGAVALSVGAGSAVSVLQNWLLRREAARSI